MSFAKPLTRLSAIIRAPVMTHPDRSTDSEWFLPYDGPVEPPPPIRHPFASDIPQPKPIRPTPKPEPRERDEVRSRSRSRSRDAKRKSQRSYHALDAGGGVGAYPGPDKDHVSVHSDHTLGHVRARSAGLGVIDPKYTFPWSGTDDSTVSSGKHSDPPLMFANHPFRMHTVSPPPRSHTASISTSTTPWVQTIAASPVPPDPAPMRKRTLTYQPGLVTSFGSSAESRVGYRESGAFVELDDREREKIRPTLLPPSLSLLGHRQYDLGSHPYAATTGPVRETRFGSVSTTTTTTTGTGKPPIPPRPTGLKLKSSLKASVSTPELRIRIPSTVPSISRTPDIEHAQSQVVGSRPIPRSAPGPTSTGSGPAATLEARTICDALIFARPRFRVTAHEITPPPSPEADNRASVLVGESGFKGLVCLPRKKPSRDSVKLREKASRESVKPKREENPKFKTVEDVLRDGAQLEKEREEWNAIGQGGLLNNRARSLSRSYSKAGGARVGGARPRRETHSNGTDEGKAAWGTLKLKRSVEMFGALALAQGKGHAPSSSVSTRRHGTQRSVSATTSTSHVRGASTSTHSRAESWGQRIACSASSMDDLGQSTEGLLPAPRRPPPQDYPVVDIRPVPARDANRARAPVRPSRSPGPSNALLQPPTPEGSVIGLALSTPTTATLVLHNHPFAQRAGAFPATPPPVSAGPETIASRHRHPPMSSGSTDRAMLNLGAAERAPVSGMVSRSAPPAVAEHPFVARQSIIGPSGAVQQMFETAMLNSAGGEQTFELPQVDRRASPEHPRRGSGDSGIGSSVQEHGGSFGRAAGLAVRGSAFGPPSGFENMLATQSPPELPKTSPYSLTGSLSPASRPDVLTRTSSGMIDPALAGVSTRSHESSSSSFSSPRPLCSIDDIESLRDIFYRPSPIPRVASNSGLRHAQDESPASGPVLSEEEEPESEDEDEDEFERTERPEEWTFGRRPFELERDSHLIWERQDSHDDKPLRINVAPGTPSPPPMPLSRDVPESVHDSDSQSGHSVGTTSSQRATNENITFGVVPSAHPIDALSVDPESYRQSTALSLIDMYDYDISISSSSPNTPQNHQGFPSPFNRPSTLHSNTSESYPRESYYTVSTAASRPGMDHLISGFPTPPEGASPISSSVLSSYFTVDSPSAHRRQDDEYR